jgi:hypothetical protein
MGLRAAETCQPRGLEKRLHIWPVLLLVAGILCSTCGYHFGEHYRESKVLGEHAISIGKFTNETSYSRVGITLGEKIKDAMLANGYNGNFDGGGNYLIKGSVHDLKERPVGFSEERFGLEYEISCVVSLELIETDTGKIIFNLKNYGDTSTYYRGTDPSYSRTNREKAVDHVLERISLRFIDFLKEI